MGIRPELHATPTGDGRYVFRPACYTLSKDEKRVFCQFLNDLKVPDGYSSNISRCVSLAECKISGMKCHDCHVLLHRYLPLAIRGLLNKVACEALLELCTYLRELCAKVLHFDDLERLEKSIPVTLCKLEKIFPPSIFDIMVHLTIHLASEAKVAGPVQFRWMYFVERYLRRLKSYVRNKARPEGSIAEAYIVQECMHFCSRYLHGTETRLNRAGRNDGRNGVRSHSRLQVFSQVGESLIGNKYEELSLTEWAKARMYVLQNCDEITEFVDMHKEKLREKDPRNVEGRHRDEFYEWFKTHVNQLHDEGSQMVNDELWNLAKGPDIRVHRHMSFLINGWRFNTKDRDLQLKTQNSGIFVKGDVNAGNLDYFGVLTDIIQLYYQGQNTVILFKADWWDVHHKSGFKIDKFGFPMVNVTRKLKTNEPYVLASQAGQVYYVKDIKEPNWQVVVKTKPRDLYDLPKNDEPCQENEDFGFTPHESTAEDDNDVMISLDRSDLEPATVEGNSSNIDVMGVEEDETDCDEDSFINDDDD
ncbi:hypothetical protein CCACVL1_09462 [Corchorus capsularis]|uniref:DUF4218 domain-containing protein n=1 Tax=Corchorus capsularis TaxID=210143 RepID=A0A1R3IW15_COCAP|nr:hypothetical protein CCACVL1_09462 [Corchorus capsularis]